MDLSTALKNINRWLDERRVVKVAIIGPLAEIVDSGWGSAVADDDTSQLRLVYRRDGSEAEVDEVFDVSGSTATEDTIWEAPPELRDRYGHFDESMGFALPDGRLIL